MFKRGYPGLTRSRIRHMPLRGRRERQSTTHYALYDYGARQLSMNNEQLIAWSCCAMCGKYISVY